ncbi:hypothetical protein HDU98_009434 [Podochytrium sp. JEL0797]|nr:hypothetical protein HDU98_009434 [Podochytrium sp. JEL0797]
MAIWKSIFWFNILSCIFVPLGVLSEVLKWGNQGAAIHFAAILIDSSPLSGDIPTFVLNFCAIIPLAKVLDYSTDQLAMRFGETLGGLFNATFGNAVELIVGILALKQGLLRIVQASLIGSILSNLLLVLGLSFLLGGLVPYSRDMYQEFSVDSANVNTGLLAVVTLGFVVPTAFGMSGPVGGEGVVEISRGTAVMLLITYGMFLVFQIKTNPNGLVISARDVKKGKTSEQVLLSKEEEQRRAGEFEIEDEEEEEEERPDTLAVVAFASLVGATVVIGICAEFLVGSLEGLSLQLGWSETFIGIILLPIVGNAAEHLTAVSSAMRNKMDLVISVAVGSSMQIALLVAPLLVLIGWMIGQPLTLDFELFETAVLFVTIYVTSTLISDGRSHWLEGWMLLASYVIIALAFFFVKV